MDGMVLSIAASCLLTPILFAFTPLRFLSGFMVSLALLIVVTASYCASKYYVVDLKLWWLNLDRTGFLFSEQLRTVAPQHRNACPKSYQFANGAPLGVPGHRVISVSRSTIQCGHIHNSAPSSKFSSNEMAPPLCTIGSGQKLTRSCSFIRLRISTLSRSTWG